MPLSNDNQDYGKSDEKNKDNSAANSGNGKMNSDDLKGKKVDADLDKEEDKPVDEKTS